MGKNKTIVVEGGGFRTAFTAGILDAFIVSDYHPFDRYIGVSGGAMALSYYLSGQYKFYINGMKFLAKDPNFLKISNIFAGTGYMNIDYVRQLAMTRYPFDVDKALDFIWKQDKLVRFVATNRKNGKAEFLAPSKEHWVEMIIASSTLPFVTKGVHRVGNQDLMDGGWSDPLPVLRAYETGSEDILILRTTPKNSRVSQGWMDYFASFYFRDNKGFSSCFYDSYTLYNKNVDFINNPPKHVSIQQIAPKKHLNSGTISYSADSVRRDYHTGLDAGLEYIAEIKRVNEKVYKKS